MPSTEIAASAGEHWAYQVSRKDPLVEVEVVRMGTQRPARVLVSFIYDAFEGRQDWVPPSRLKVLWSVIEAYLAREARWARIETRPGDDSTFEHYAMDAIFRMSLTPDLFSVVYRYPGVGEIPDVERLAAELELVARRICERISDRIMAHVLKEEAGARQHGAHGYRLRSSRGAALSCIYAD